MVDTAQLVAEDHGLKPINGTTIRICYGPSGEIFCVPIYAINLPVKYNAVDDNKAQAEPEVPVEVLTVIFLNPTCVVESAKSFEGEGR